MSTSARLLRALAAIAMAVIALGAGLAAPRPALAHANFVSSLPAPGSVVTRAPEEVRITFSEDVEPRFSSIRVFDTGGQRVDAGPAQGDPFDRKLLRVILKPLDNGIYTVSWQALSAVDGHPTAGSFNFAVGPSELAWQLALAAPQEDGTSVSAVEVILRFLLFASAAVIGGAILFRHLVLLPAAAAAGLRLTDDHAPDAVLRWAALALLVAALGMVANRFATAGPDALITTRVGLLLLARLGFSGALLAICWGAPRTWPQRSDIALVVILGVLLTVSLNSHAAAVAGASSVGIVLDYLHLLAMAAWSGGLAALLLFLTTGLKAIQEEERPRLLGQLVPRFSLLAGGAVAVLVASGAFAALALERRPAALVTTAHGWGLTVKLALVAMVLAIAAVNLLVMRPRLGQVTGPRARAWRRRFHLLVGAETAGVTLVLLAAGVLTTTSPPVAAGQTGPGLRSALDVEGLRVSLVVSPGQVGPNLFQVELRDAEGRPVSAQQVLLKFNLQEQNLGESIVAMAERSPGRFEATGGFLGLPGTWAITVAAQAPAAPDAEAVFSLSVPAFGHPSLIPASTGAAVDAGRRLYGQLCARCHGVTGFGDGPDGIGLKPPPLNLNAHVPFHADQVLFQFIADGLPGTAMLSWKGTLREDQIWALVHYLRATFKEEQQ